MLYDPIGSDREGNEINLMDILRSEEVDVLDMVELKIELFRLIDKFACLTQRERTVLQLRFGLGMHERQTQREIGQQLGISRSYVSRIEKRALGKLQNAMSP